MKKTNGQKFVFLHNHSRYSPLDGLISLKRWIEIAKERNWEYLGLTDTDGVYGMIHFIQLNVQEVEKQPKSTIGII